MMRYDLNSQKTMTKTKTKSYEVSNRKFVKLICEFSGYLLQLGLCPGWVYIAFTVVTTCLLLMPLNYQMILTIFSQGLLLLPLNHHDNWLRQRGDQNCGRSRLLPSLWHCWHPIHALGPRRCWRHTRRTHAGPEYSLSIYLNLSVNLSVQKHKNYPECFKGDLGEQQGACTGVGREDGNLENTEG